MDSEKKFQTDKVITLSLAHMLHDTYSRFLAPILPLLIEKHGLSYAAAGLLSVIGRLTALLNPAIGALADKLPLRWLVIVAPAVTALAMSFLGIAPTYGILALLLCGMGIGSNLFHIPSPVMIKLISGKQLGKGMSFYMFGGELARSLSPIIILGAVSLWGLEGTWRLAFFGIGLSLILYFKLRRITAAPQTLKKKKEKGVFHTFLIHAPLFSILAGFIFFRALLAACLTVFLPTYLTRQGETLWLAGISLSLLQFSGAVSTFFSGAFSDKIGRQTVLFIAALTSPLLMWLFILSSGPWRFILIILMGISLFSQGPVLLAFVHDIDHERPAFINSLYMAINFIFTALAALVIGKSSDLLGMETTYKLAPLTAVLAIAFISGLTHKPPSAAAISKQ